MTQKFDMNQYSTLAEAIASLLAPYDKKTIESQVAYADRAQAKMKEFEDSEKAKDMKRENRALYAQYLLVLAGGQGWIKIIQETKSGSDRRYNVIAKKCDANFEARNSRIAAKLTKAGVKEVKDATVNYTHGGFVGCFTVGTEQGNKVVTLEVIVAGGHTVQCLHNRVLVKIK